MIYKVRLLLLIVFPALGVKGNMAVCLADYCKRLVRPWALLLLMCWIVFAFCYSCVVVYWVLKVVQDGFECCSFTSPSHGK